MWRKALTLLVLAVVVGAVVVGIGIPGFFARCLGLGLASIAMTTANYSFYLHLTRQSRSWNPFEGTSGR